MVPDRAELKTLIRVVAYPLRSRRWQLSRVSEMTLGISFEAQTQESSICPSSPSDHQQDIC